ncbi:Kelch motifGalactose oxidase central domain [Trypanosoma vivax]|nr:Kelch motifGalactose oxidase central domain [Trypanosoma vivax]
MFHSASSYIGGTDHGQRVLVYGGTTNFGKTAENELYEFSLLSGAWRRVEGKQIPPLGHYCHSAVTVCSLHRLVLIGGVGPGGQPPPLLESIADDTRRLRFQLLFPSDIGKGAQRQHPLRTKALEAEKLTLLSLANRGEHLPPLGFMPVIFDMDLRTNKWRQLKTSPETPVALHSAVVNDKTIYIFGGVTNRLQVSAQLISVDAETYHISVIPSKDSSPKARYLHSAVVYGRWIVVYGGFDAHNELLADVWAFDLQSQGWEQLECSGTPARAAHGACLVGSRLVVVGGFESAIDGSEPPTNSVYELNLVPNAAGKYTWRQLHVRQAIPPLVFSVACPCVDEVSFIVYGGCTVAAKGQVPRKQEHGRKAASHENGRGGSACDENSSKGGEENEGDKFQLWNKLIAFGEGFVMTFPLKCVEKKEGEDGPHVNQYGVEVDPDELPAEFLAFVRRQQDFLLKKNANAAQIMKKVTLEEQEGMEPRMHLKPGEIEQLLEESVQLCECFTVYSMDSLPPHVPDRQLRLHLNEECISLSRQVRDVVRSMKANPAAMSVVKSKTHRFKAGQEQDHSAPKPFRRVVVMNLMRQIRTNLKRVHAMNKALKSVVWPEKDEYLEAFSTMRQRADGFVQCVRDILEGYIEKRVNSLITAVETRNKNLLRLAEAVERSKQREVLQQSVIHCQRMRPKKLPSACARASGALSVRSQRLASPLGDCEHIRPSTTGTGYYKDDSQANIALDAKQVQRLIDKSEDVQKRAIAFASYCSTTMLASPAQMATQLPLPITPGTNEAAPVGDLPSNADPSLAIPADMAISTFPAADPSTVCSAAGIDPGPVNPLDCVWKSSAEEAESVHECICNFIKTLKSTGSTVGESDESSKPVGNGNGKVLLHLVSLYPLLECKARIEQLRGRASSACSEQTFVRNSNGEKEARDALRQLERLFRSISALVQHITASFLSKAGAKPPSTGRSRVQHAPVPPCTNSSRHSRSRAINVKPLKEPPQVEAALSELQEPSECEQGTRSKLQAPSVLLKLSAPVARDDVCMHLPSSAVPEAFRSISITSAEAVALAPAVVDAVPAASDGVIVPSSRDVKVIRNVSPYGYPGGCEKVTVTVPQGVVAEGNRTEHSGTAPQSCAESLRITVSQGPKVMAQEERLSAQMPSFIDSIRIPYETGMESNRNATGSMVSVVPAFFHTDDVPRPAMVGTVEGTSSAQHLEESILEEDYFNFGRRVRAAAIDAGLGDIDCALEGAPRREVSRAPRSFSREVCRVSTSPQVGSLAAAADLESRAPRAMYGRYRDVRRVLFDNDMKTDVEDGIPGRLAPSEARLPQAKRRLRAPSSQR